MFRCTTSTWPMPLHTTSIAIILMALGRFILHTLPIFLFCLNIYSTSGGTMDFSFMRIWGIITIRTMVLGIFSMTSFSSLSTSLGRYCIHFKEWFGFSWPRLMISHQKLIILFSNKKTWYWFKVFCKSMLSILSLQKHIWGIKFSKSFF